MCAIAAIFSYGPNAAEVDPGELLKIRDAMRPRGPDGAGEWYSANRRIGLAHRRLSIIDLSANGSQPMVTEDGRLAVTFNGEIYNYRELRRQLEQKGYCFRSQSDTEVLLHLYAEMGEEMVHQLRGMYAFAIWDQKQQAFLMARDPFGVKPLYYADDGKTLRAASQVKALLSGGGIASHAEPAGHVGFFLWGSIPEPYTLYKEVRALPAGTILRIDAEGNRRTRTFCQIRHLLASAETRPSDAAQPQEALAAALNESVRCHLLADVPVGIFLSSGIDSTILAALARQTAQEVRTVTLGFEEFRGTEADETPLAEMTARRLHTTHQTIWVTRRDFQEHLENIFASMDQPSIDGINTYFVSLAAAKASLKVALSGLGGDELFGGYSSFQQIPRLVSVLAPLRALRGAGSMVRKIAHPFLKRTTSPKYAGLLEYGTTCAGAYLLRRGLFMPWELAEFLDPEFVQEGCRELHVLERLEESVARLSSTHLKISALEVCWYMRNQLLRDSDWASMAHSLEIRVPFVDLPLLQAVASSLASEKPLTKLDLARTPRQALPEAIVQRPKTGFTVPVRDWLIERQPSKRRERGLRGWARMVYSRFDNHDALKVPSASDSGLSVADLRPSCQTS